MITYIVNFFQIYMNANSKFITTGRVLYELVPNFFNNPVLIYDYAASVSRYLFQLIAIQSNIYLNY